MPSKRHKKSSDLFRAACEMAPDARAAFLEEACAGDTKLRADVEALLAHDEQHPSFLEHPTRPDNQGRSAPETEAVRADRDRPGLAKRSHQKTGILTGAPERVGPYKILQEVGEGGMGVVYLAEQTEPIRRRVALKLIKLGMDTKQVIARFETERQALALMNHPNVAKVLDAGATEKGRPYFVMEYVKGEFITAYCDRHRLTTRERLGLFMQVCQAVQHAHQKGIIHRDLKPSNVLVAVEGDKPVPKVIDFGVAKATQQKLTERTLFTEQGQLIGTPEYMSPEQAEMTALDIDTRTDIYSLGVLLYELLVGALPFDPTSLRRAAFTEIQKAIREQEPPKPSTRLSSLGDESTTAAANRRTDRTSLERQLRSDLDWITMKAIEKDRTRRYATAAEFAADIARHLNHQPVLASPPSAAYRLSKFLRRNKGPVTAAAVIAIVLLAATGVSIGFAISEAEQRRIAVAAEQQQGRAREEAEQAREAEKTAKEEVQKRADELQTVTEFQASMLRDVDAEVMGRAIVNDLRERIREGLEAEETPPEKIETAIASFDELAVLVNTTDLALKVMDENVLSRAVETIDEQFADQALVRAALQQTVADTYSEIGLYESAMPLQEAALQTRRQELGDDHPDTLTSIGNMGVLLQSVGNLVEAEPYYREALEGFRRVLGADHPDTLSSINNMGFLLQSMGKNEEALPYWREALEGLRRVLGDDHPDTLTSINNMGALLQRMGKLEEAEGHFREALEAYRRVLGNDHPDTLMSINNMGFLLKSMGKNEEAMLYYCEALQGRRRVLGDEHPHTLISINNMGLLLESMGKNEEAMLYYREALQGRRRVLGDDHPHTLISINNMGYLLRSIGKLAEAESHYREALERFRRVLGDDHPDTLISIHNMGGLLRDLGRLEEAEVLGAEAVERAKRSLPERHWFTGVFLGAYGKTLGQLERYAEAEAALAEAHQIIEAALGAEHKRTVKVINALADLYAAWGKAERAAEWRAKLPPADDGAAEPAPER